MAKRRPERKCEPDTGGPRATFYASGREHSPTSATGMSWEPVPWHATQRAAWEALKKIEESDP